jgi:hypothetical protein
VHAARNSRRSSGKIGKAQGGEVKETLKGKKEGNQIRNPEEGNKIAGMLQFIGRELTALAPFVVYFFPAKEKHQPQLSY